MCGCSVVLSLLPALASSAGDQVRELDPVELQQGMRVLVSGRFLEKSKLAVRMTLWAMTCSLLLAAAQRYIHQLTINSFSSLRLPVLDILILTTINYTRCIFYILPSARLSRRSLLVSMFSSASAAAADRIFLVSKVGCDYSLVDKIVSPDQ